MIQAQLENDISSTVSYDFSWNLAKALVLSHVQRRSLNGLVSSVKLKMKMFLGTAVLVDEPVPKVEKRFTGTGQGRKCQLHIANCHTKTEKDNAPNSTKQCQSFGISIFRFAMAAYNEILFFISYSFCLAFRLCFSMIVFYASLQAIKLSLLENKSRYVCCIFAIISYLHLAQKVNQFLKKRELYVFYRPNQ